MRVSDVPGGADRSLPIRRQEHSDRRADVSPLIESMSGNSVWLIVRPNYETIIGASVTLNTKSAWLSRRIVTLRDNNRVSPTAAGGAHVRPNPLPLYRPVDSRAGDAEQVRQFSGAVFPRP